MTYSRFLFIAAALLWAAPVNALQCLNDYAGTTGCAGNSQAAGNCQTLGYSTENVEGCAHYVYCPFNTSYKRCTSVTTAEENKCAGYTLSSCPTGGICSSCEQKYKLDSCRFGWTQNESACDINPCTDYTLLSCPAGAPCLSCQSGNTTKYKLDTSNIRNCGTSEWLLDYGVECPPNGNCDVCMLGTTLRTTLEDCNSGYYADPSVMECYPSECLNNIDEYMASGFPKDKKVTSTCKYYNGGTEDDYMLYYKFGTTACGSSVYKIIDYQCTFGFDEKNSCMEVRSPDLTLRSYTISCRGTDNQSAYGCQGELNTVWLPAPSSWSGAVQEGTSTCYSLGSKSYDKAHTCVYNGKTYYHYC